MAKKGGSGAHGHAKKHAHAAKHVHGKHPKHHPAHQKAAHHQTQKRKVHTVGHHQSHAKGLAVVPGDVACCVSEALAASLRHLQPPGLSITAADVLALHRAAGADDERGAPILAVLEAASELTLAGFRPVFEEVMPNAPGHNDSRHAELGLRASRAGLILGVDLPGPHTVLATPEGWWSWGELFCPWCDFPDAVIDEAWEVSWRRS